MAKNSKLSASLLCRGMRCQHFIDMNINMYMHTYIYTYIYLHISPGKGAASLLGVFFAEAGAANTLG